MIKGEISTNQIWRFVCYTRWVRQPAVRLFEFEFFLSSFFYNKNSIMIDNPEEQLQRVVNRLRKVVEDYSAQVI